MRRHSLLFAFLFALLTAGASAQTGKPALQPLPEPPPPPAGYEPDPAEEAVTIVNPEDKVEEFRHNGKPYMIRVTPPHGKPYYLIDKNGNGEWSRHDGPTTNISIPMWVIGTF